MFSRYKVRNFFGKYYTICVSVNDVPPQGLDEQIFSDQLSAVRFLRNLSVRENYWKQLIFHVNGTASSANNDSALNWVAQLILSRKIKIYEISRVNIVDDSSEDRTFTQNNGNRFQIVPAIMLFDESPVNPRSFNNSEEAIKYIRAASPDKKQLRAVTEFVETTGEDSAAVIPGNEEDLLAKLGDAIVAGKIAVVDVKSFTPPPPEPEESDDLRVDQKIPLTPDVDKKWCHLIVKETKVDGKLVPIKANISFVLPSGLGQNATTDVNGAASVSTSDQQGSFDIKQVDTLEDNAIFEFVSLA